MTCLIDYNNYYKVHLYVFLYFFIRSARVCSIKCYIHLSDIRQNKMTASFSKKEFSGFAVPVTGDITTVSLAPADLAFENAVISKVELLFGFYENKTGQIREDIEDAGFSCTYCGRCCQREEADNSVFLLPQEIEKIENATGMRKTDFILPLFPDFYTDGGASSVQVDVKRFAEIVKSIPDQIDEEGRIHTFGWMLQRDENGRCIFLNSRPAGGTGSAEAVESAKVIGFAKSAEAAGSAKSVEATGSAKSAEVAGSAKSAEAAGFAESAGAKRCGIYDVRPGLCRTYPFYLDENGIEDCKCEGLSWNSKTDAALSDEFVKAVIERQLAEQDDLLRTRQYVKDEGGRVLFNTEHGIENALNDLKAGVLKFIVYDGCGVHHTQIRIPELK